jgi:hypothetical protein
MRLRSKTGLMVGTKQVLRLSYFNQDEKRLESSWYPTLNQMREGWATQFCGNLSGEKDGGYSTPL